MGLQASKRIEAMRVEQEVALDLFERRGFDRVTIEEIAGAARVGVATVYRHFGMKERLVLWDEYDPQLLHALASHLRRTPPLEALKEVVGAGLRMVDAHAVERILRRGRLIAATPALRVASASELTVLRRALARLLRGAGAVGDELEAEVVAGALVATLEAAIWHWVAGGGRRTLRQTLAMAFRRLERLNLTGKHRRIRRRRLSGDRRRGVLRRGRRRPGASGGGSFLECNGDARAGFVSLPVAP